MTMMRTPFEREPEEAKEGGVILVLDLPYPTHAVGGGRWYRSIHPQVLSS